MSSLKSWLTSLLLLSTCFISASNAQTLKVAVASNFYHSLSELIKQAQLDYEVKLSSGSSGLLYAQISKGAPFDVFLSADVERPHLLTEQGLAYSKQTYAIGQLVLWPANGAPKDILSSFKGKLVIANPRLAPYGKAAMETLDALSLKQAYSARLIKANNINQAFQFVDSGNAKMALLAKSQLLQAQQSSRKSDKYAHYQVVPASYHSSLEQQLVILKRSQERTLAEQFVTWLMSDKVQSKLIKLGYGIQQ